jgi:hypothetical protein
MTGIFISRLTGWSGSQHRQPPRGVIRANALAHIERTKALAAATTDDPPLQSRSIAEFLALDLTDRKKG